MNHVASNSASTCVVGQLSRSETGFKGRNRATFYIRGSILAVRVDGCDCVEHGSFTSFEGYFSYPWACGGSGFSEILRITILLGKHRAQETASIGTTLAQPSYLALVSREQVRSVASHC